MKEIDYGFIGACGLYCGECNIYLAFKNDDKQLKEEIAKDFGFESSYVHCEELGFWRTRNRERVDFIVKGAEGGVSFD